MSTALRIIILVVEILAYITIFVFKECSLKRKEDYTKDDKKIRHIEFAATTVILMLLIVFIFPAHIFLSYKKLVVIGGFVVTCSIWFLNNKLRIKFYEDETTRPYVYLIYTPIIIAVIISNTATIFEPKELAKYDTKQYTYWVEDELKSIGNGKIAEVIDENGETTSYFFIIEDDEGNDITEVVEPLELIYHLDNYPNEHAYIEKYVHSKIYTYPEMKEETIEEEEYIEYRFYINKELLTEIKM